MVNQQLVVCKSLAVTSSRKKPRSTVVGQPPKSMKCLSAMTYLLHVVQSHISLVVAAVVILGGFSVLDDPVKGLR